MIEIMSCSKLLISLQWLNSFTYHPGISVFFNDAFSLVVHKSFSDSGQCSASWRYYGFLIHRKFLHKAKIFVFFCCWISAVDFFNQVNLLYGTLTEFCTPENCPTMTAGPKYGYSLFLLVKLGISNLCIIVFSRSKIYVAEYFSCVMLNFHILYIQLEKKEGVPAKLDISF